MNALGNEIGASVYSEAKSEYTKQLTHHILTPFHRFFIDSFTKAIEEEQNSRKVLSHYQDILSQIPEWNIDKVERETNKLITESNCDYLEELVTAVFIAHTKILTAIRLGNKNKKVQITVPKLNHFIHRALTESGRLLWASIFLFQNDLPSIEKQKNHRQIESLIKDGIQNAISGLLPIKSILKDNIPDMDDNDDEDEDTHEDKADNTLDDINDHDAKVQEAPVQEAPVQEAPVQEAPVQEVKVQEAPVQEVKVQEAPFQETKVEDKPIEANNSLKPIPVQKQVSVIKEDAPTIIIDSAPQVKFADMIHIREAEGNMQYENSPIFDNNDNNIKILDEDAGEISDIEDLDVEESEKLGIADFEEL